MDEVHLPVQFWKMLSTDEFMAIVERGTLDEAQCAQIWRMTDRQGAPPKSLTVMVRKSDAVEVSPPRA